jgi:hypothetical protein
LNRDDYLAAPVVPEPIGDTFSALFIAQGGADASNLEPDTVLAAANRVPLRELVRARTAKVLATESGIPTSICP